MKRPI